LSASWWVLSANRNADAFLRRNYFLSLDARIGAEWAVLEGMLVNNLYGLW
jgi:hypothetical protein